MKLTNQKIYDYAIGLGETFQDTTQSLPIKINFYLQKNKNTLMELAKDIESARLSIINNYGEPSEDGTQYIIPKEKMPQVQKELLDLFELEQDVNIYTISIDSLSDDIALTTGQMEAIMFMID